MRILSYTWNRIYSKRLKCKIDCKRYIAEEIRNEVPTDKATCFLPWLVDCALQISVTAYIYALCLSRMNGTPTLASICLSIYIIRGIYRRLSRILPNISYPIILNLSNARIEPSVRYLRYLHISAFYETLIMKLDILYLCRKIYFKL